MEYSPMMVVMLWALTPSDAGSVPAHVEELPPPGMTVHQESYFTFNHGKPFVAEQDPLTGAILNLKTTPVLADDYTYDEEEEESDGIDRKDGPKTYTRNDIIQPSKDPDLHKFLNLPVHYSTSGKFPLISSSYANTKVQGHSANAQSNHRLTPTSSTTTVSPSYYPLKTSATTTRASTTTTIPTPTTTTSKTTTRSTTTTTTSMPTTTTKTTTTTTTRPPPPPSAYEYEYYDYDNEPDANKKTTTQRIFEFFDKDYAFLGASEEEKNVSKVEYVMPAPPQKPQTEEKETMISPTSNLFIPSDYLKPTIVEPEKENKTAATSSENRETLLNKTTNEFSSPINGTTSNNLNSTKNEESLHNERPLPEVPNREDDAIQSEIKNITQIIFEQTTPKAELNATKPPNKETKVPFFPTLPPDLEENIFGTPSKPTESSPSPTQKFPETKPTEMSTPVIKPIPFYPTIPLATNDNQQDSQVQPTRPVADTIKPFNPYQGPYSTNSNVPPEMQPPVRPVEPNYNKRPVADSYTYRPIDSFHLPQYWPQNPRPLETGNRPATNDHRPNLFEHQAKPTATAIQTQKPTDDRPNENMYRPDGSIGGRPMIPGPTKQPTDAPLIQHSRPYDIAPPYRPDIPHVSHADSTIGHRPPLPHPDNRYPQYTRPLEVKPEKRPQQTPEYRPEQLPQMTPDQRPQSIPDRRPQPDHRPQHTPDQRPQHTSDQRPQHASDQRPQHMPEHRPQNRPQQTPEHRPQVPEHRPQKVPEHRPQQVPEYRPQLATENRPQSIPEYRPLGPRPEENRPSGDQEFSVSLGTRIPEVNKKRPENPILSNNNYQVQFTQPSKVENHFIKVSPGQENPSYSLQTSFSIGVPPPDEIQGQGSATSESVGPNGNKGIGQVLFPDESEKHPWVHQEEKRPSLPGSDGEKYPRPPWETHLKPPLVFNHLKKDPYPHKRPKPVRPDLPNILPQFRPNAKIGHAEPHVYLKTPLDTLQPPPLPRPQFLRAEPPILPEEEITVHRRNGQITRPQFSPPEVPIQPIVQNPKRGSVRSEDEKTDPVFVVYPSNNAQDGVVVGTRGPQRPLPPDNLDIEDSFPLDTNKNFQARVDTPILKVKPSNKPVIKNEFPYPLVKPTDINEEKPVTTITKEYTAFSPTLPPAEKEHDTEINIIPYLQDYMPFATKKPAQDRPKWDLGEEIKPISVTLKTQKTEETTSKLENHKTGDTPTPQDFQAPFHASLSAPSQGWSVVRPRPEPEKEEETTTVKIVEETEGKFDIQNFKPQLFGGFKPIIPPIENKDPVKEEKENE